MLKANNKKARENIRHYIVSHYDPNGYNNAPDENASFHEIACFIFDTFMKEKSYEIKRHAWNMVDLGVIFQDWCQGLPSIIDTCYYYNRYAKPEVMEILEQTENEAEKYDEQVAADYLTLLIFRELEKEVNRS